MKATAPIRAVGPAPQAAPVQTLLHRTEEEVQRQGLHGWIAVQVVAQALTRGRVAQAAGDRRVTERKH
jgi:hypothetical protein